MSTAFAAVEGNLKEFDLLSFTDPAKVDRYCELFGIRDLCMQLEADRTGSSTPELLRSVSAAEVKPYEPKWGDLCRLHWLQLSRKVLNVLELGSGYSTAVLADGARLLSESFRTWAESNLRVETPFHVFSVEEEQRFLDITQQRLGEELSAYASLSRSSVEMILYDERIATLYSELPNISPDFIYLDGPSQFATTQQMNGFSFCSPARMPMSADILRFEFFLEPGTLVLVDGRTANARFLKHYFRRNWGYFYDAAGDVHYFELQEDPLGKYNRRKLEFCLDNKWLLAK
jgi:hypothetical protein